LKERVTIYTIAKKLNISSTTVYRALNNKDRISEETKTKVLQLAKELGFKPNALAKTLHRKRIRIAVFIETGYYDFERYIINGVQDMEKELHDYGVNIDYYRVEYASRQRTNEKIDEFRKTMNHISTLNYDGVLMCGESDNEAYRRLEERNIPIAFVVTDEKSVKRRFCVQYDGYTAGRMAAELLFWKVGRNGRVALANGFEDIQIHNQCERGFLEYAAFLHLNVVSVLYNEEDSGIAYRHTNKLIKEHPDLKGIYICTFASSGVIRSVVRNGKAGRICLVTSDINDEIRECLDKGIVSASIFQDQYRQGRYALRYLYDYITSHQKIDDVTYIYPQIILKSNMAFYRD
jgi:LacI family transcriptional regulator